MTGYNVAYSEIKYKKVSANTTDTTGGITVPNTEVCAVVRFRANGADPSCYVSLIWDYGGGSEKVICSTKGDVDIVFDSSISDYQFTGNGSKKMSIVIFNDNSAQSPIVGGSWEGVKIG